MAAGKKVDFTSWEDQVICKVTRSEGIIIEEFRVYFVVYRAWFQIYPEAKHYSEYAPG